MMKWFIIGVIGKMTLQPFDSYGRLQGKVICSEKNLNSELLENDHAWILTQYCSTTEFSDEVWAKKFGC
jgi:micrococcal nuclease